MYLLDEKNRSAILKAVEKRIAQFPEVIPDIGTMGPPTVTEPAKAIEITILFLEVLRPMNGTAQNTLQFIKDKTEEADFDVPRLENGKNPYGLNGCMAAMIDFFTSATILRKNTAWNKYLRHTCSIQATPLETENFYLRIQA